eukprot:jgi/Picsp_1/5804/NSC_03163-R1_---NA---
MSVLVRARISSFLAGVGVTTAVCMFQLKNDIDHSQKIVLKAVKAESEQIENRMKLLEQDVAQLISKSSTVMNL